MQPVQDLTIDATVSRTQYQFVLEDANPGGICDLGAEAARSGCEQIPQLEDVGSTFRENGLSAYVMIDRDTAAPLRHHPGDRRQRALRRLRPAHRLDDLHPDRTSTG